jgi:RHS repeat-associated protein
VYVYDVLDRLTQTKYADETTSSLTYDKLGQVISQTNQLGNTTSYEYDERNRNTAVIDALGQRTSYGYDLIGNLTSIKDANLHITSYEYDALNRRTATIIPLGQRSITSYDAIGNVTSSTDFNGQTITYTYDVMNRLKTNQLGTNNSVTYFYTQNGQLSSTIDTRGTTSYNYDQRDRLIKQTETDGQTLQYTYDKASNWTSITTQAGTTTYGYDRYNELTTVTDKNGGVTTYTYDKAGNRTKIQMADGTVETRNYDLLNHLIKQETSNASGVIAGYTYTLDAGGKRVELLENNGRKVDYSYDKLDRLLTEQITDPTNGNRTTGYLYDPIGNRVSKTDSVAGVTTYVYDNNDRLLTETNGTKITTSTYDNNGNNLTRGDGTTLTTNTWDIENRLVQSVTDGSTTIYRYDPNGVRVSSQTNGVETRYLVDRNRPHASVVMEYDLNGNLIVDYTYGIGLISQHRGSATSFYHADGLGSTRLLTDSSGSVTDAYVYDAYGTLLSSSGTTTNSYLYTGEQYDKNLGEYYLRARYYSPSQGRFTGRDPFEGMLSEPLSLNKYAYVHGNPINSTDPSGWTSLLELETTTDVGAALQAQAYATIQANNIRSSIFALGVGTLNLPQQLTLMLDTHTLKNCNATSDEGCQVLGIPIAFSTNFYYGKPQHVTTFHIAEAIVTQGKSPLLTLWRRDDTTPKPTLHGSRNWYTFPFPKFPDKDKNPCTIFKAGMKGNQASQWGCDEYPFWSTYEGGETNGKQGKVSLQIVPVDESEAQGPFLGKAQNAGVVVGLPFLNMFGVVALPFTNESSYWRDRRGHKVR